MLGRLGVALGLQGFLDTIVGIGMQKFRIGGIAQCEAPKPVVLL